MVKCIKCPNCNSNLNWYQRLHLTRLWYFQCPYCKSTLEYPKYIKVITILTYPIGVLLAIPPIVLEEKEIWSSIESKIYFASAGFFLIILAIIVFRNFNYIINKNYKYPVNLKWYQLRKYKGIIIYLSPILLLWIPMLCPNRILLYYAKYKNDLKPHVQFYGNKINIPSNWIPMIQENGHWWYEVLDCCNIKGRVLIESNKKYLLASQRMIVLSKENPQLFEIKKISQNGYTVYFIEFKEKENKNSHDRFIISYIPDSYNISTHLSVLKDLEYFHSINSNKDLNEVLKIIISYYKSL